MRSLLFLSLPCLFAFISGSSLVAEDDPIKTKVEKVKEAHQLEADRITNLLFDYFEKAEESARKKGDKKAVDQIKADRKTFDETNEIPKSMPTSIRQRVQTAQKSLEGAYGQAIKDYTKAKQDDKAAVTATELQSVRLLAPYGGILMKPVGLWTFEKDAKDLVGEMHGELFDGAKVEDGRLKLGGNKAKMVTSSSGVTITERTLEAWLIPSKSHSRDEIVFAIESKWDPWDGLQLKKTREWFLGSSSGHRSKRMDGQEPKLDKLKPIHVAITYGKDGRITFYREGKPHGDVYTPKGEYGETQIYEKKVARIVLGVSLFENDSVSNFTGEFEEFRLYSKALTPAQVEASFLRGFTK